MRTTLKKTQKRGRVERPWEPTGITIQEDKDREVYKSKITWLGKEVKDEDNIEEDAEEEVEEIMVFRSDEDVAERRLLEIGLPMEEEEEEEEEMESKGPFKRKTTGESSFPTEGLTPAD